MSGPPRLQPGSFYHIWNRGVDRSVIFRSESDYWRFLEGYASRIAPVAATYNFCLIPNHFHFLVRTYTEDEQRELYLKHATGDKREPFAFSEPSTSFGNLLNSYVRSSNLRWQRTGALFEGRFGRKLVDSDDYLRRLVVYIHRNPQEHGLVSDFRNWPYSSYAMLLGTLPTGLQRDDVLSWFGGRAGFIAAHRTAVQEEPASMNESAPSWEMTLTTASSR
jgi:REP element-mobilizing transposase RayT